MLQLPSFKPIRTLRHLSNCFYPFHYFYTTYKDFDLIKWKVNFYFFLFPAKRKIYSKEIDFLNHQAKGGKTCLYLLPYPFVLAYDVEKVEVFKDEAKDLFYVMQKGKKLYYSRSFTSGDAVKQSFNSLTMEQDVQSPHRYMDNQFKVKENDVVVDIGAAEGNFSLDIVEMVSKLYVIESDLNWIEALKATFEPWKDKVEIIHKYVTDSNNEQCATLESIVGDQPVDFLKMDVEGAEVSILESSGRFLEKNQALKLAICTYHRKNDEKTIKQILEKIGFQYITTKGSILFVYGDLTPPFFRSALIRAWKP